MYYDCIRCNHCGKIYRLYSCGMPKYCKKCGNHITDFQSTIIKDTLTIKNATKIVAKRTLFGWKEREIKDEV